MKIRVLTIFEKDEITNFENSIKNSLPPEEQIFAKWNSSTRSEFLDHYLPLGWSMGIWDNKQNLKGFFLAQVILFYRSKMQSLHIEHISYLNEEVFNTLLDTAYKCAREKHLQDIVLTSDHDKIKYNHTKDEYVTIPLQSSKIQHRIN